MPLRVSVIGAGHLGQIHARLLKRLEEVELAAIVDPCPQARQRAAEQFGVPVYGDVDQLPEQIQAAVVAAPTSLHGQIGMRLLHRHIHLLMEKPLANDLQEGEMLVETARQNGLVLQVGHVEQFNPAVLQLRDRLADCRYLQVRRCSPYSFRSTDVSVILDLMIHDLDLVLSILPARHRLVTAWGSTCIGPFWDTAQAQLAFHNGCLVDVLASRVAVRPERTWVAAGDTWLAQFDLAARQAEWSLSAGSTRGSGVFSTDRRSAENPPSSPLEVIQVVAPADANPLRDELLNFAHSVAGYEEPRVSGQQALQALRVADQIEQQIRAGEGWQELRRAG